MNDDPAGNESLSQAIARQRLAGRYRAYKRFAATRDGQAILRDLKALVDYDRPTLTSDTHMTYARMAQWHLVHAIVCMVEMPMDALLSFAASGPPDRGLAQADPLWDTPINDDFLDTATQTQT